MLRELGWEPDDDDQEFDDWLTEEEIEATRKQLQQRAASVPSTTTATVLASAVPIAAAMDPEPDLTFDDLHEPRASWELLDGKDWLAGVRTVEDTIPL